MNKGGHLINVITHWMEGEISSVIDVWLSTLVCLSACHFAAKMLPGGAPRLVIFLPVVALFLLLPLQLHSVHFCGITAFFLSWLATFKLQMLAFNKGPLSNPSISLPKFLALACLPIKLQSLEKFEVLHNKRGHKSLSSHAVKILVLALIIKSYSYTRHMHPKILLCIYCLHIYLALEIILAAAAAPARGLLGLVLEPQFDEPYLSASLQEFWGRRWNLMVTRILHPAVYLPVLGWTEAIIGRKWASLPAVIATFAISGLMHELLFYYLGRMKPTWEVTLFFLLHGVCVTVEIVVKKALNGRWRLPRAAGAVLTVGFMTATASWLFFPQYLRCKADERGLAELAAAGAFVKDVVGALGFKVNS